MSQPEKVVGSLKVKIRCYKADDMEELKAPHNNTYYYTILYDIIRYYTIYINLDAEYERICCVELI